MKPPPLFRLTCLKEDDDSRTYRIRDEDDLPVQDVLFTISTREITFHEPRGTPPHLRENIDHLRSILFTTLQIGTIGDIDIPFSFPEKPESKTLPDKHITLHGDGSCTARGEGGWCAIVTGTDKSIQEYSGFEVNTSSNRMELLAILMGLRAVNMPADDTTAILIVTDSIYVKSGILQRLQCWKRNGFITALNEEVKNRDLWLEIDRIINDRDVHVRWIPSKSEDPLHQRCDAVSRHEADRAAKGTRL